ncbi:adenosylcobinamide amidohydrolase [Haloglomus litoreum]|uniref:adenosylcobinamide amidohydrolase n=1 Tax=Haloglomus litoreum TaxID=3034026 RepID=UPI0023E8BA9E|nr:adenosylcobinamide amidohydrolase [Haloglomus sp. DT116]
MSEGGPDGGTSAGAGVTATVRADVCRVGAPAEWHWLVTGGRGGTRRARAAYNLTVPEGFGRTDLDAYARGRRREAGFEDDGPTLLTGVSMAHARLAVRGPVTVLATGGLSNPATLPLVGGDSSSLADEAGADDDPPVGTVNLVVATDRALAEGTLAELLATAVEAKTATLLATTGFTGTTSDAVAVGCDPGGDPAEFAGSATAVGAATRACVRDALLASLDARYDGRAGELPDSVAVAEYGVVTDETARVFEPDRAE